MTPQENQVLQDFLDQLTQVRGIAKDPQAEALIARAVSLQPDAAYLLVQRVMILDQALNQSKIQISQLQSELQTARTSSATSFLDAGNTWGRSSIDAPRPGTAAVAANAPQNPVALQSPSVPTAAKPSFLSGNTGSFLTNVAATAAGVAGGAFLFQGIENLMGHHSSGAGFLGQSGTAPAPVENTTINNYYAADTSADDSDDDSSNDDDLASI